MTNQIDPKLTLKVSNRNLGPKWSISMHELKVEALFVLDLNGNFTKWPDWE